MTPNPVTHRSDGTTAIHIVRKAVPYDCIIDTVDYPKVQDFRWNVKPDVKPSGRTTWNAYTSQKHITIHQILLGKYCDHVDHDGLNNRQSNLRPATRRQNACNRRKRIGNYTSKYKGVYSEKGKWIMRIDGQTIGRFSTETAAALAYNVEATIRHGEFAVLNEIGG